MEPVGRIRVRGNVEGIGFAVAPRLVLTANHVLQDRDAPDLGFELDERSIPIEQVDRDETIDAAVLHLSEDVPGPICAARAAAEARWRVESQPRPNDPMLTGTITAIGWRIKNARDHEVETVQLRVEQLVGWHAGYSGSPVMSPPGARTAVGVLVEQVKSRVPNPTNAPLAASNALYAVPIEHVIERFDLGSVVTWGAKPEEEGATTPTDDEIEDRVSGVRVSTTVEHWRDREELLAKLRELLVHSDQRVISVVGLRGIGKSALVAKVLAEFEEADPLRDPLEDLSPVVYLSSRRSGDLTLAAVYQAVAAVWSDERTHELALHWQTGGVDSLPDLWQRLRHHRPVIVLDNLDDLQKPLTHELGDAELVALLDSACRTPYEPKVVTTSQHPLNLPTDLASCVRVLEVPSGLTGADAVAVIRNSAPSGAQALESISDEQLAEAAERVDGRPRGLQKLGLLIDSKPRAFRRLLESDSAPDELFAELVSTTYELLSGDSKLVVELLALARAPIHESDVPKLLDGLARRSDVQDAIDSLVDAGEVKAHDESGLLELHPLDADFVRGELVEHDRERQVTLDTRFAAWWEQQRKPLGDWRRLEDATPSKREYRHRWRAGEHAQALAVLGDAARFLSRFGESHVVKSAVRAADDELDPSDTVAQFHARRCEAMAEFFAGSLEDAKQALTTARELAKSAGLNEALPQVEVDLGAVLRHKGETAEAVELLARLADAGEQAPIARHVRELALFDLGLSLLYAREMDRALEIADRLDRLVSDEDVSEARAMRANLRALAQIAGGEYEGAEASATEAIDCYRESPSWPNAGYMMNLRGLARLARGDVDDATAELEAAAAMAADYRTDRLEGLCATNLAWALLRGGDVHAALLAAERGADRLSSIGVSIAPSPRALADAIRQHRGGTSEQVRAALGEASRLSLGNPDIHQPTDDFLDAAAATLADAAVPS